MQSKTIFIGSFFSIILFGFFGCAVKYNMNDYGSPRPANPNFSLKDQMKSYEGDWLVDTNVVYLNAESNISMGPYRYDTLFSFIRFFPDGRFYHSKSFTKTPNAQELSLLVDGIVGFFEIQNNEILAETFTRHEGGAYFYSRFKVKEDEIIFYKEKIRCWYCGWTRFSLTYKKHHVIQLKGIPDW